MALRPLARRGGHVGRVEVRLLLTSTRFVASLFWLTIVVATMLFVLPYSERNTSPVFPWFVAMSIVVYLGHRFFPYEGYHPWAFSLLLLATDALVAMMVYLTGGSRSGLSLLYLTVIIFSSAYFDLLETLLFTAVTSAVYFAPFLYERMDLATLKEMAMSVPVYFLIALSGFFVISKAREQEREKKKLSDIIDRADRKNRELSELYAASIRFASTLNPEEIIEVLEEKAGNLVPADAMLVCLYEGGEVLRLRSSRNLRDGEAFLSHPPEANPLYVAASAVLPVTITRADEDPRFDPYMREVGFSSMICVPLFASSSVIGVLACLSRLEEAYDDDDARVLLTLASEAALALEKAGLYRTTLEDKSKIETIINSLTDALLVLDREGKVVLANPTALRLFGLWTGAPEEPIGRTLRRAEGEVEFREVGLEEALRSVLLEGRQVKNEMVLKAESAIYFQVMWLPLRDSTGGVIGAVVILHDVTDFVELDRMKSNFISMVSHELKTPLTSIKGFVRLLDAGRVGPVNEKQRRYLEIVLQQTESLTKIIEDLLDLSRIEAGIIEVRREKVDLRGVAEGVMIGLENLAREKGVEVYLEMPEGLPPVAGDPERLRQVFTNLIHNALKFTPSGGKVHMRAREMDGECLVEVEDTGIGISPQDLPRIFDKFYQVDSSSTRHQSGTGLGLSISRELITAQGGRMWAESEKGKGTTFKFTVPLWDGANPVKAETGREGTGESGS
ncbi:MAG: ATP-binding protein [Actinomycetota bacterium]|nr:ATP-binding protein [Actinomycetota bacterium]